MFLLVEEQLRGLSHTHLHTADFPTTSLTACMNAILQLEGFVLTHVKSPGSSSLEMRIPAELFVWILLPLLLPPVSTLAKFLVLDPR